MNPPPIELVCLDLAGTTVRDDGLVEHAFLAALDAVAPDEPVARRAAALRYVHETMGQSKIAVFRALFEEEATAQEANAAFEDAYGRGFLEVGVEPIDGAVETIDALRASGRKVCLLTGFSVATRDLLLDALGWNDLADLALCPEEVGRGRPYPDLVLSAILRLEIDDVASVAVVGDTAADMLTARRAGSRLRVGVLTGADDRARLESAGATFVAESVAGLAELVEHGVFTEPPTSA